MVVDFVGFRRRYSAMKRAETSRKASSAEGGAAAGGGVALAVAAAAGEAGAAFGAEAQASAKRQSAEAAASERSERAMPSLLPENSPRGRAPWSVAPTRGPRRIAFASGRTQCAASQRVWSSCL